MPSEVAARLEAWKRLLPDYKVKVWGEAESPRHLRYLVVALGGKYWANASNLMRLWVLYREGGIYLDTDVDLIKSFDPLLEEDAFVGFQSSPQSGEFMVNNAVLGAVPAHPFIEDCLGLLLSEFDGTEKAALSSPVLTTRVLLGHGLVRHGDQTLYEGRLKLLDHEAFYPYSYSEAPAKDDSFITAKTYAVHRWHISWRVEPPGFWEKWLVRALSAAWLRASTFARKLCERFPRLQRIVLATRKQHVEKMLWRRRRVMTGLFAGTRFATLEHTGSSITPKLLGTYEFAVQQVLAGWAARDYGVIYNVGCECGGMLLGLAAIFPKARLLGFDVNAQACSAARVNLQNSAEHAEIFHREFTWDDVQPGPGRSLLLCDIEGGEKLLFKNRPGLLPEDIIIELHEFVDPSIPSVVSALLKDTHTVRIVRETAPPLSVFRNTPVVSLADAGDIADEKRPISMCWLVAEQT